MIAEPGALWQSLAPVVIYSFSGRAETLRLAGRPHFDPSRDVVLTPGNEERLSAAEISDHKCHRLE